MRDVVDAALKAQRAVFQRLGIDLEVALRGSHAVPIVKSGSASRDAVYALPAAIQQVSAHIALLVHAGIAVLHRKIAAVHADGGDVGALAAGYVSEICRGELLRRGRPWVNGAGYLLAVEIEVGQVCVHSGAVEAAWAVEQLIQAQLFQTAEARLIDGG